jgi:hypothetical protein
MTATHPPGSRTELERHRGDRPASSPGRRWRRGAVLVTAVVATALVGGLAWVTIHPRVDAPERVDALLVLYSQSDVYDRALELAEEGVAGTLLVSVPVGAMHSERICDAEVGETEIVCFRPRPSTTQGEAIFARGFMADRGLESLGVLTFDHHLARSEMLVERCWSGPVHTYLLDRPHRSILEWWSSLAYGMTAYTKVFLTPGCETQLPRWVQQPLDWAKSLRNALDEALLSARPGRH